MNTREHPVIIIAGPTASGKTAVSYDLSNKLPIEIINADMGQMYAPLSVGTAKPDWRNESIPHHLFDIIDEPQALSVSKYRERLIDVVKQVRARGNVPVLVGGSFFYLKSIFFPIYGKPPFSQKSEKDFVSINHPEERAQANVPGRRSFPILRSFSEGGSEGCSKDSEDLWDELNQVDPERAAQIHPNDHYRVQRALHIWRSMGVKPSEYQPTFDAPFSVHFIVLVPERSVLFDRINCRTVNMMTASTSWLDEVKHLRGTEWESFLKQKKIIGYPELFEWLERGAQPDELENVVARIQTLTRHYAKRQLCFWSTFREQLKRGFEASEFSCTIQEISEWGQTELLSLPISYSRTICHEKVVSP